MRLESIISGIALATLFAHRVVADVDDATVAAAFAAPLTADAEPSALEKSAAPAQPADADQHAAMVEALEQALREASEAAQ